MLVSPRAGRLRPLPTTWLAWMLPVFAWAPLAYPGYFEFLNGFSPVFNLNDFLRSGASIAWTPTIGQPFDLLRGDGRLAYLFAALPRLAGASAMTSVKMVLAASILAGAVATYGWTRRRLGPWPALVAAGVYTFWPMGLATIYVRGALADAVLLAIMPLAWWAADAAGEPNRWPARAGLALALAAALMVQPGLACWLCTGVLVYLMARARLAPSPAPTGVPAAHEAHPLLGALVAWGAGVLLGLIALAPAALAHGGTGNGTYVNFGQQFVYLHQLLQPGAPAASAVRAANLAVPLQLGLMACGLSAIGVVLASEHRPDEPQIISSGAVSRHVIWLAVGLAVAPILLSLVWTAPLWASLPWLQRTLTYPWQLLLLAGPWLAWLAGLGAAVLAGRLPGQPDPETNARHPSNQTMLLFTALLALALLGAYGDLNPPSTPVPVPDRPLAVFGDNEIALLSAQAPAIPQPGQPISVTVQWQALRPLGKDYSVFVHALSPDGALRAQRDTMPRGNRYPTSQWTPGKVVEDVYTLNLDPGVTAPTPLQYELGLYQYQTGERLPVASGDDKVVVDITSGTQGRDR